MLSDLLTKLQDSAKPSPILTPKCARFSSQIKNYKMTQKDTTNISKFMDSCLSFKSISPLQ